MVRRRRGRYGDTRDAIRVGADAWLLGHGAHLALPSATVTVVPLGLAVLCGYVTYRLACWVGATSAVDDLRGVPTGATVLSGVYSLVAVVTAVLASHHQAEPASGAPSSAASCSPSSPVPPASPAERAGVAWSAPRCPGGPRWWPPVPSRCCC